MKIKSIYYYISLLGLLAISDIFFYLNVNPFYINTIFMSLVLICGIGTLSLSLLKTIGKNIWEDLIYSIALSAAYIMIGGLIFNFLFLTIGYTKPLTLFPLTGFINISLFIFILINWLQDKKRIFHFSYIRSPSLLNTCLYFIVTLIPLFMIAGITILNNGGSNLVILLTVLLISITIVVLALLSHRVDESVYPYSIFMISLGLLCMISMRTNHIMGTDILSEFRMFNSTITHGYWARLLERHAYNACISITVLPTILAHILGVQKEFIFKFIMQILFSFTPVTVYLLSNKYTKSVWAFLGTILYISFPIFIVAMPMHIRQEVAFLFFGLLVYILFDDNLKHSSRTALYIVFGSSMVISHYSTTYIALGLFVIWYCSHPFFTISTIFLKKISRLNKYISAVKVPRRLNGILLLLLILFSFFWYTQVTTIGNNLVTFGSKTFSNLSRIFSNDVRVDQTSVSNQFNVMFKQQDTQKLLSQYYAEELKSNQGREAVQKYDPKLYSYYKPVIIKANNVPLKIPRRYQISVTVFLEIIKKIQKLFIIIGSLYLVYLSFRNAEIDRDYMLLTLSSLILLLAFMVLPYVTIDYDLLRTTQQILLVLAYPSILGALFFIRIKKEWVKELIISAFVILYFFTYTDFISQIMGGASPAIAYNNYGPAYERLVVNTGEIQGAKWLEANKKKIYLVHADQDSVTRLLMSTLSSVNTNSGFLPFQLYRTSYVFLNSFNVKKHVTYRSFHGELLRFLIPKQFYDDNKDLIYSNSDSEIYY